jgi:hypothetical protein
VLPHELTFYAVRLSKFVVSAIPPWDRRGGRASGRVTPQVADLGVTLGHCCLRQAKLGRRHHVGTAAVAATATRRREPEIVLPRISSHSNSASVAKIPNTSRPLAVVVSMLAAEAVELPDDESITLAQCLEAGLQTGRIVLAIQDRDGAGLVFDKIRRRFPWLELIWADGGYNAWQVDAAMAKVPPLSTEIVKRSDDTRGFVVLPRR